MLPEALNIPRANDKIFRRKEAWKPQKWSPHYEEIVAMSCTGVSNKYLAKKFDYTEVHISNILNTPQAKQLKQIILEKAREHNLESDLPARLERLKEASFSVLEEVLITRRIELMKDSPFAMVDRATKTLQGLGSLKIEGGNTTNNIGKIEINAELQVALIETIKKSDQALKLHAG